MIAAAALWSRLLSLAVSLRAVIRPNHCCIAAKSTRYFDILGGIVESRLPGLGTLEIGTTINGTMPRRLGSVRRAPWLQLAAFQRDVAGNSARKTELFEQPFHSRFILFDVWVIFGVSSFQIRIRDKTGTTVTGSGDKDHAQIVFVDDAIQVCVDEVQPWCRSPMPKQSWLDVLF